MLSLFKSEVFWIAITGIATGVASTAVFIAVRQLRFEAWLRAYEIWSADAFTKQRGEIFAFLDRADKTVPSANTETALEVCRKLDEFAGLIPYLPKRRALQVWGVPFAKAWVLLSTIVADERKKSKWPEKWNELERFGKEALELHPEVSLQERVAPEVIPPPKSYFLKRKELIYALVYPAVLAGAIVGISVRIALYPSITDNYFLERISLGSLLVVFFCASFLGSEKINTYPPRAMLFDFLELLFMFAGFHFLGLFLPERTDPPLATLAYLILIFLIPLDMIWLQAVREKPIHLWELRILAVIPLAAGLVFGKRSWWITPSVSTFTLLPIYLYVFTPNWYLRVRQALKLERGG
jgi:hypothetical protein